MCAGNPAGRRCSGSQDLAAKVNVQPSFSFHFAPEIATSAVFVWHSVRFNPADHGCI